MKQEIKNQIWIVITYFILPWMQLSGGNAATWWYEARERERKWCGDMTTHKQKRKRKLWQQFWSKQKLSKLRQELFTCQDKQTNKQFWNSNVCNLYIYCWQKWPLEIYGAYPRPQKSLFSLLTWINPPPFANISTLQTLQLSILWFWNRKSECETLPLPMFQHCNCQCFIACKRCECESCKRPFLCCDLPNLRNKLKLKFNCENWGVPTSVTCPV